MYLADIVNDHNEDKKKTNEIVGQRIINSLANIIEEYNTQCLEIYNVKNNQDKYALKIAKDVYLMGYIRQQLLEWRIYIKPKYSNGIRQSAMLKDNTNIYLLGNNHNEKYMIIDLEKKGDRECVGNYQNKRTKKKIIMSYMQSERLENNLLDKIDRYMEFEDIETVSCLSTYFEYTIDCNNRLGYCITDLHILNKKDILEMERVNKKYGLYIRHYVPEEHIIWRISKKIGDNVNNVFNIGSGNNQEYSKLKFIIKVAVGIIVLKNLFR